MFLIVAFLPHADSVSLITDAWQRLRLARSVSVTVVSTTAEFGGDSRVRYAYRSPGFFRADNGSVIDVATPKGGWTFSPAKRKYQLRPALQRDYNFASGNDFGAFRGDFAPKSSPMETTWHKHRALKVEVDGTVFSKETKMFLFVDAGTHLPLGISANLGSVTQVKVFENLKLNTKLSDNLFTFTPPKGWRKVTSSSGGWK